VTEPSLPLTRRRRPETGGWTLRRRLIRTFVVSGVLIAIVATLASFAMVRTVSRTNELLNNIGPARIAGYELQAALLNEETGIRGYALTKNLEFLEPYNTGRITERAKLAALRASTADHKSMQRLLVRITERAQTWRTGYAEPTIAAARLGRTLPVAADQRGRALFDAIRAAVTDFQNALTVYRNVLRADLTSATRTLWGVGVAALVGVLIAGLVLWVALRRWILDPLMGVSAESKLVVDGNLEHRVAVTGPREITALAADVEAMRESLVRTLAVSMAAHEQVQASAELLEAQAADLRRSNAELEQFAYVASHDLQEPLRKVASFCQMLSRRYSGQLDERGDQYIEFAVDGAKRMQRLINDLLAFSRVGRTTGGFEEVSLDKVLDRALTSLSTALEETGTQVEADPLPVVSGNATLLTQVFQNLIGNAAKFRGDDPPRVRITVRTDGDKYEFACTDNGIGIEPQYAERVFVIFQRLHGKEQYDGTGIGLAMCRKIIEHHGGRIWLDVPEDSAAEIPGTAETADIAPERVGTTFRWTLPVPSALGAGTDNGPEIESATDHEPAAVGGSARTEGPR
jgi:signal transduction histidine kinase